MKVEHLLGHLVVLKVLYEETKPNGEMCVPFKTIAKKTIFDVKQIRRSCRFLKRKGWAEFHTALRTEDGDFVGAGYCISHEGRKYLIEKYLNLEMEEPYEE